MKILMHNFDIKDLGRYYKSYNWDKYLVGMVIRFKLLVFPIGKELKVKFIMMKVLEF